MRSGMFDNTEVYSADFARFAGGLLTNGVLADTDDALKVSAGSGMHVSIAPGYCWINGRFGVAETAETLTIPASDGSLGRIDRIVARLDLSAPSVSLQVLQGEASASPVAPSPVREGNYYDLGLATVSVPAGTLEITAALITDTRENNDVCGAVIYRNADKMALESKANKESALEVIWEGASPAAPQSGYNQAKTYTRPGTSYTVRYLNTYFEAVGKRHEFYIFTPTYNPLSGNANNYYMISEKGLKGYTAIKLGTVFIGTSSTSSSNLFGVSLYDSGATSDLMYIFDYYVEGDEAHFAICHRGNSNSDSSARPLRIYGFGEPFDLT